MILPLQQLFAPVHILGRRKLHCIGKRLTPHLERFAVQHALEAQEPVIPAVERRVRRERTQERRPAALCQGRRLHRDGLADAEAAVLRGHHDGVDIPHNRRLSALADELKARQHMGRTHEPAVHLRHDRRAHVRQQRVKFRGEGQRIAEHIPPQKRQRRDIRRAVFS